MGEGVVAKYMEAIDILNNPVDVAPEQLASYAGCYFSDLGSLFKYTIENGHLAGAREGWDDFRLYVKSQNHFFMRTGPKLDFQFNSTSMNILANGQVYTFTKEACQ